MKKYKFITIKKDENRKFKNRDCYSIFNNKTQDELGWIFYYIPWKQYVLSANSTAVYNKDCLRDIADFIENEIVLDK